jgi:hypothetical protein
MTQNDKQTKQSLIYQLKISLSGSQPLIWRQIQVPGDITLFKLHFILQIAMGWTNSHLHEFIIGSQYYGDPQGDEWDNRGTQDEGEYRLEQVIPGKGIQFGYMYDFGDGWQHTIKVEDIFERKDEPHYPTCLDGERACPPEDVGGIGGYGYFLEAIQDPQHPEHEDYLAWAGGDFDPEAFDREQIDEELRNLDRSEMVRIHLRYTSSEVGPEFKLYQTISDWLGSLTEGERSQLKELPLRQDTVHLLSYLRDHRITGTQATGNLPLKAIREVTANFVHPPVLDQKIGDQTYKLRSEYDVWPVYFIHALLETGGLLLGGKARRLRLTSKGEQFLASEPPLQLLFLLETWWYHTNWLIAAPFIEIDDYQTHFFGYTTLDLLLESPVETPIVYEGFADSLIQATVLKRYASNMVHGRESLHRSIERAVIDILHDFRAVERIEKDARIGSYRYKALSAFRITRLGRGLLQAVAGWL